MEIRIQFFASLRDTFGEWLDLSVKEGASAADVLTALADLNPQVASLLGVSCCATTLSVVAMSTSPCSVMLSLTGFPLDWC